MSGVAKHAEDTLGQSRRHPPHDILPLQNEQVVYVPGDNYRSPSMEAKHK